MQDSAVRLPQTISRQSNLPAIYGSIRLGFSENRSQISMKKKLPRMNNFDYRIICEI